MVNGLGVGAPARPSGQRLNDDWAPAAWAEAPGGVLTRWGPACALLAGTLTAVALVVALAARLVRAAAAPAPP